MNIFGDSAGREFLGLGTSRAHEAELGCFNCDSTGFP